MCAVIVYHYNGLLMTNVHHPLKEIVAKAILIAFLKEHWSIYKSVMGIKCEFSS